MRAVDRRWVGWCRSRDRLGHCRTWRLRLRCSFFLFLRPLAVDFEEIVC